MCPETRALKRGHREERGACNSTPSLHVWMRGRSRVDEDLGGRDTAPQVWCLRKCPRPARDHIEQFIDTFEAG